MKVRDLIVKLISEDWLDHDVAMMDKEHTKHEIGEFFLSYTSDTIYLVHKDEK